MIVIKTIGISCLVSLFKAVTLVKADFTDIICKYKNGKYQGVQVVVYSIAIRHTQNCTPYAALWGMWDLYDATN